MEIGTTTTDWAAAPVSPGGEDTGQGWQENKDNGLTSGRLAVNGDVNTQRLFNAFHAE